MNKKEKRGDGEELDIHFFFLLLKIGTEGRRNGKREQKGNMKKRLIKIYFDG